MKNKKITTGRKGPAVKRECAITVGASPRGHPDRSSIDLWAGTGACPYGSRLGKYRACIMFRYFPKLQMETTLVVSIFVFLILNFSLVSAQDRPAQVQIDCREGSGLLPSAWRGVVMADGDGAKSISVRTVCLDGPVAHAWAMRRRGGDYDWRPLEIALAELKVRRAEAVLILPVSKFKDEHWKELVTATVNQVAGRDILLEFRAAPDTDLEHYLDYYEMGAWAAYQANMRVSVGGPGLDWRGEGVEALVRRCSERKIPLHVMTWVVNVKSVDDPARSVAAMAQLREQYDLETRPEGMITGWRVDAGENVDALALGLSGLMSVMTSDVKAMCLADTTDQAGWAAVRALNPMKGVRLPMVIQAPDGGLTGLAHLEYNTILALFWHSRTDGATPATVTFSGLPWGDRMRIEQLELTPGMDEMGLVAVETQPFHEPAGVEVEIGGGVLTAVRVVIE